MNVLEPFDAAHWKAAARDVIALIVYNHSNTAVDLIIICCLHPRFKILLVILFVDDFTSSLSDVYRTA